MKTPIVLLACLATTFACALGAGAGPEKKPPLATPQESIDAQKVLRSAREKAAEIKAASYHAVVRVQTKDAATPTEDGKAQVVLSRADAGGWKIWIKGESLGLWQPGENAKQRETPEQFQVGFDGAMAWSLREGEQTLLEKTVRVPADLQSFFVTQLAAAAAPWELIAERPLDPAPGATVTGVAIPGDNKEKWSAVTFTPQAGDPAKPPAVTLVFTPDHLLRRIERTDAHARTIIEITRLQLNTDAEPGVFTMSPPDDFLVKSADLKKPSKPRDQPKDVGLPTNAGLLAAGSQAPEFKLKDPEGKQHRLSDYKGKVVLIDFWGTWCPPCRAAMPSIQELHKKYEKDGLAVLGLNFEAQPDADPAKYMRDNGFTYQLLLKAETIARDYKVPGWPTFYILDREGKVVWSGMGFVPSHHEQMIKAIEGALGKSEDPGT